MMENAEEITMKELEENFNYFIDEAQSGKCFIVVHPDGYKVALVPAELTTVLDKPQ